MDKEFHSAEWADFQEAWNEPNRLPGCLPRASKPGEWCPLASEHIKVIPRNEWSDLLSDPNHMRLWPSVWTVLDQDGQGSCFPPGTLIRMANGSEKPIEKVAVLDEVLTAEGNCRREHGPKQKQSP